MLYLVGNPLVLTPQYRAIVKQKFQPLKMLDGTPTLNESDSPKKRKKKVGELETPIISISDKFSLDLHFRVL